MTGGKLSHGTKEQYPWGRYRWLDSLLGLPTKRQRLFLSHRLATSPLSNALGCLVFLGTPFYVKKWERNGKWEKNGVRNGVSRSIVGHEKLAFPYVTPFLASALIFLTFRPFPPPSLSCSLPTPSDSHSPTSHHSLPRLSSSCLQPLASASRCPTVQPSVAETSTTRPTDLLFQALTLFLLMQPLITALHPSSLQLSRSTAFYSGNIYHSPDFDWSHAMSALVVHAGKLDEASMALSSEPIARAYVFPHLADMLKLPFWKPLPQFPPHDAVPLDWLLYIASFGRILLWNIIFILPALILSLLSHIVAPLVIGAVRNVIVVISFGLAQNELSFAHVFMDEILDLGLSSQHVEHWNVQVLHLGPSSQHVEHWNVQVKGWWVQVKGWWVQNKLSFAHVFEHEKLLALAKTRSLQGELMAGYEDDTCDMGEAVFEEGLLGEGPRESEVEGKTRGQEQLLYEYLWDDKELDEAAAKCLTYQCLEPEINKMWKNPRLTPQQFVRQIKQLCVMIEDRFSELTGKLDLNHGAYFRDPRILGVVAHFLEFRELPEWSREIDADVMRAERMVHSG
ncbi:unnamed protein product [Closterium sp. NIES-65]|nr:unnamed protein product [Closterium sp. NIES-65]